MSSTAAAPISTSGNALLTGWIDGKNMPMLAAALGVPTAWREGMKTDEDAGPCIYLKPGCGWLLSTDGPPASRHVLIDPADQLNGPKRFGYGQPMLGDIFAWKNQLTGAVLLGRFEGAQGYDLQYAAPAKLKATDCLIRSTLTYDLKLQLTEGTVPGLADTLPAITSLLSDSASANKTALICEHLLHYQRRRIAVEGLANELRQLIPADYEGDYRSALNGENCPHCKVVCAHNNVLCPGRVAWLVSPADDNIGSLGMWGVHMSLQDNPHRHGVRDSDVIFPLTQLIQKGALQEADVYRLFVSNLEPLGIPYAE